jgi:type IV secretory pathway VirB4 component
MNIGISSQQFLPIEQIREGAIIMKDHSLRGVMMASSLNFALKEIEEQEAIIMQFQTFLNSLDFSFQVVVVSRKVNITGYLEKLKIVEQEQQNDLLRMQTREYRNFVEKLVEGGSIMNKNFYLVVPFYLSEIFGGKTKGGLFNLKSAPALTEEIFQRCKSQLYQRMEFLSLGLRRCGVWAVSLNSEELIELYWSLSHPKEASIGYYPEIPPELIQ